MNLRPSLLGCQAISARCLPMFCKFLQTAAALWRVLPPLCCISPPNQTPVAVGQARLRGMDGEEPEDWPFVELIDASSKYDFEETGEGHVIEGPIDLVFNVRIRQSWEAVSEMTSLKGVASGIMSPKQIRNWVETGLFGTQKSGFEDRRPDFWWSLGHSYGHALRRREMCHVSYDGNPKAPIGTGHFGRIHSKSRSQPLFSYRQY